jgi:nitrous oxide reductase accessory protein NosL
MKKTLLIAAAVGFLSASCGKNKCAECHYDGPAGEVEMGAFCGDELHDLEEFGTYTDSLGNTYVVHCGEH